MNNAAGDLGQASLSKSRQVCWHLEILESKRKIQVFLGLFGICLWIIGFNWLIKTLELILILFSVC